MSPTKSTVRAFLALAALASALSVWRCGGAGSNPTGVSPTPQSTTASVGSPSSPAPTTSDGSAPAVFSGMPGDGNPAAVSFPPRNEPFDFGSQLNVLYRDTLRRGAVSAFVDLEGWIVWIQEYLRYRVNACSHADAVARVFTQILGGGIPPVCGTAPAGEVAFPPRDQSFDFGNQLNAFYRDTLRRGAVTTFVDLEGWIVWLQEYQRYRVNSCNHTEGAQKVFLQIAGAGVQPVCSPPGPPPPPASCSYGLTSSTVFSFSSAGGTGTVTITAPAGCGWFIDTFSGSEDFVRVDGGVQLGSGSKNFTVRSIGAAPIPPLPRSGPVVVLEQGTNRRLFTITINQS